MPHRDPLDRPGRPGAGPAAAPDTLSRAAAADAGQTGAAQRESVTLTVNGRRETVEVDVRRSLLDLLREQLDLTGSKKGCDHGQCGACTVLVNGRRINACLSLAVMHDGDEVVTVEGLEAIDAQTLAPGGTMGSGAAALGDVPSLHPLQAAFVREDAFQCGYCTPGQLCSGVALLGELAAGEASIVTWERADADGADAVGAAPASDEELRERMSGNLCRCGAYPNILGALRRTLGQIEEGAERADRGPGRDGARGGTG